MCMIREDMKFVGLIAFYEQKDRIKAKYNKLDRNEKALYKYYVYSRRQLKEHTCDLILLYLNNTCQDDGTFVTNNMLKAECNKYRM